MCTFSIRNKQKEYYLVKTDLMLIYTGCPILNNALKFLENYGRYGKMCQTKEVRRRKIPLI